MAFALHAPEPDELADLREHLTGCPSCRATVTETELTAAELATAVEQVDPPARLRENILAQVARIPQTEPALTPDAVSAAGSVVGEVRRRAGQNHAGGDGSGRRRSPAGTAPHVRRDTRRPGRSRRRF
ncbi:MAG: zf-HC2 domain-containing protein, partial [Pseudonocardia sp.]